MSAGRLLSPSRPRSGWRGVLSLLALLLAVLAGSGCVTLYQPQRAVHGPVVVERSPNNFAGLRVLVRCTPHDEFLPAGDARWLCGRLARDFEAQGAEAEWVVPRRRGAVEPVPFDGAGADLTVEIESRIDHEREYALSAVCAACTYTCLPAVSEHTFSQRVVVYGRDRSVLTEDVMRARFVEYFGCGVWSLNWVLDWLVRDKADRISGDAPKKRFAEDFYGQIRQLTFNARVRAEVLGVLEPQPGPRLEPQSPAPAPPPPEDTSPLLTPPPLSRAAPGAVEF